MNGPIMFGSINKVNEYKKQQGIEVTPSIEDKPETSTMGAFQIGGDIENGEVVIKDDERALLDKVLLKSDPDEVFMQENVGFYDRYYLSNSKKLDDELLQEARKIRRIYKNYTKFMYACYIRERYLDMLDETYGADSEFKFVVNNIKIPDDVFIPPNPIYSRNAPDYDKAMAGILPTELPIDEPTYEDLMEFFQDLLTILEIDIDSVGIKYDVCTDRIVDRVYDDYTSQSSGKKFSGPSVNVTDLDNLQRLIKSWHKKEDEKQEAKRKIPFPESDAGKRHQFINEFAYYIVDHIDDPLVEVQDENELVYDEKSKKTMTRKEHSQRTILRMMSETSGWDMVKLMQQMQVGSKLERTKLKSKSSRRKKLKKKAASFMSDILGDNSFEGDITSADELRDYLFAD